MRQPPAAMRPDLPFLLLLLCFFLSGLAALIYETAWTREFSFVFGTSNLATATVLAAYMAGLAAGAALAARFAHRIRRPILAYGLLELGIALAALAIPWAIAASRALYLAWFGGQDELPASGELSAGVFYTLCSFAILMVPTAMMGATLPLLARHAVRREREITGRIGVLYAVNTAGAVFGTLTAAHLLLPTVGLRLTIWTAAAVNAAVFAAAWALALAAPPAAPAARTAAGEAGPSRWILPLILASGAVSFGYEVLWVRLLGPILGGNIYAFATMLASFLTGIAVGSALASRLGGTPRRAAIGFSLAQLGTAALSLIAFLSIDFMTERAIDLTRVGVSRELSFALLSMLTLFPSAVCIGTTFPFAVRILARSGGEASAASARVYSANTIGSIAGSLGAGFFVVPWLGYVGTITACAALNVGLATLSALAVPLGGRLRLLALGALGLVAVAWLRPPMPWNLVTIGLEESYRAGGVVLHYYGVGRSATVLVADRAARWQLLTNGLNESFIDPPLVWHGYTLPARWLGALPVLARPDLSSLLLIGLGGGVTLESVPTSVARIDVVELEGQVVAANRALSSRRWRDPLADPRVKLHVNDARNALLLANRHFDAIVSQPSHPWTGGASNLYTREFFELAKSRLGPEGVLVQWMGLQFVDADLFASILATLESVFPHVRVYLPPPGSDAIFIASGSPLPIEQTAARAIAADPERFAELGIAIPEDVTAHLLLDEQAVREAAQGGALNRDDHNRLQTESARVDAGSLLGRIDHEYAPIDPLTRWRPELGDPFLLLDRAERGRAARLSGLRAAAQQMRGPAPLERRLARAIAEATADGGDASRARLVELLREAPRHPHARAALLRSAADEIAAGLLPESLVAPPLDAAERAVVAGWRTQAERVADTPRGLDAELASVPARHPLSRDAALLRVRRRIDSGDPQSARDALAILDPVLRSDPDDLLLRARACIAAREYAAALDTLHVLGGNFGSVGSHVSGARALLAEIPALGELRRLRISVERVLTPPRALAASGGKTRTR